MPEIIAPTTMPVWTCRENCQNLRGRLKEATAEAHRLLDARIGALDITIFADYRRFLEVIAAALLPLEAHLVASNVGEIFPDWSRRSRRKAIKADLAKLDGEVRPITIERALNRNAVFGSMYVLEGSRLGARVLLKTVRAATDPRIAETAAYLGHGTGQQLWQSFVTTLAREPFTPSDQTEVIDGALNAFELFATAVENG